MVVLAPILIPWNEKAKQTNQKKWITTDQTKKVGTPRKKKNKRLSKAKNYATQFRQCDFFLRKRRANCLLYKNGKNSHNRKKRLNGIWVRLTGVRGGQKKGWQNGNRVSVTEISLVWQAHSMWCKVSDATGTLHYGYGKAGLYFGEDPEIKLWRIYFDRKNNN